MSSHRPRLHALVASLLSASLALPAVAQGSAISQAATDPVLAEIDQLNEQFNDLYRAGKYREAVPVLERALAIWEKRVGPGHADIGNLLINLAALHMQRGDYAKAEPRALRALAVMHKTLPPGDANIATAMANLAEIYKTQGHLDKAQPLLVRALAMLVVALGPNHQRVAIAANNLGGLYLMRGDVERGVPFLERARQILEKVNGPNHPDVAILLNNLAEAWAARGEPGKVQPLYEKALGIWLRRLGDKHPNVAQVLTNLGALHAARADHGRARAMHEKALGILEVALGPKHASVGETVHALGLLAMAERDFVKAEAHMRRALASRIAALGPAHALVGQSQNNLAGVLNGQGKTADALKLYTTALATWEKALATREHNLQRKARGLDAAADAMAHLRRHLKPEDRALLKEIEDVGGQIATLYHRGPGQLSPETYRATLDALRERADGLEQRIARQSPALHEVAGPVTIERVQGAIPQGAALVELAAWWPMDARARPGTDPVGVRRYAAYVLGRSGPPQVVDLGEADALDTLARGLREALASTARKDVPRWHGRSTRS